MVECIVEKGVVDREVYRRRSDLQWCGPILSSGRLLMRRSFCLRRVWEGSILVRRMSVRCKIETIYETMSGRRSRQQCERRRGVVRTLYVLDDLTVACRMSQRRCHYFSDAPGGLSAGDRYCDFGGKRWQCSLGSFASDDEGRLKINNGRLADRHAGIRRQVTRREIAVRVR